MSSGPTEPPATEPSREEEGCKREVGVQWEGPQEERREVGVQWEEPHEDRRDVGCQWEGPKEERSEVGCQWEGPKDERSEVGCQVGVRSGPAAGRDVAVQVDLLTQQLSWRHSGSSAVSLECVAVRPDGPDGGALLQHSTTIRTRSIPVQATINPLSPDHLPSKHSQPRIQRRASPPSTRDAQHQEAPRSRRKRRAVAGANLQLQSEEVEKVLQDSRDPQQTSQQADVPLRCFAVRPDGGALLQHCTTRPTATKPIQGAMKRKAHLPRSSSSRLAQSSLQKDKTNNLRATLRHHRTRGASAGDKQPEEVELDEGEEEAGEDLADPTWTPSDSDDGSQQALKEVGQDSQHASLHVVKQETDGIMCDVCGKVMKNKSSLAQHSFIHTGKKPYGCHLCELRFNRRGNLQHHLNRLHPNGVSKLEKQRKVQTWLCEVCGKTFNCRSALKTHEVIHSGVKPFHCDLCPKAYMRLNDLEHHKKVVHVDGGGAAPRSGSLLCDLCGKEFKYKSQLAAHYQTHSSERPHVCDICGRKFGRQYQLERHKVLVHTKRANGEENQPPDAPFACSICGKRVASEALLVAHSRIHTGDKPHRCSICLRSFLHATYLKKHHLRVHLKIRVSETRLVSRHRKNPAAKTFPCPICNKVFKFKSLLANHSMIHSEVRPHACNLCSRSFKRLSHLKKHKEVVHANGAQPPQTFVCHICGKDKKCRSQLAMHVMIHTGERPFGCDLCTARFNRRGNLQQHMKRMHGVGQPPADEASPILFDEDVDMVPALTYKQEETVVAVDDVAAGSEVASQVDAT